MGSQVIYRSAGTQRYFVSHDGDGEAASGEFVDLDTGKRKEMKLGSLFNHCPYDDWQRVEGSIPNGVLDKGNEAESAPKNHLRKSTDPSVASVVAALKSLIPQASQIKPFESTAKVTMEQRIKSIIAGFKVPQLKEVAAGLGSPRRVSSKEDAWLAIRQKVLEVVLARESIAY